MEWLLGRSQNILDIIFFAADQQCSKGDIQVLRAKRVLEDLSPKSQTPDNWKVHVGWLKLRALLKLLPGTSSRP